ncbi:DUF2911 domain-containing protein [Leptobacterium sp. I13]|uniref:DUF2911 domain-containing protein n=1 Tax=Leptobacterium meishanense TaxID=3128904 RepID=UPI0030EBE73B
MKKIISLLCLATIVCFTDTVSAQRFSDLDKSPHDISYYRMRRGDDPDIKVLYGRPQMKGRKIFGGIVPYDRVWRTGANEATEVTFYRDFRLGGTTLKAGTYVLYSIPGENEWTIILNSKLHVWGAYSYDKRHDVASVKVPVKTDTKPLEAFSITFKDGENLSIYMILGWDTTRIWVPIEMD